MEYRPVLLSIVYNMFCHQVIIYIYIYSSHHGYPLIHCSNTIRLALCPATRPLDRIRDIKIMFQTVMSYIVSLGEFRDRHKTCV